MPGMFHVTTSLLAAIFRIWGFGSSFPLLIVADTPGYGEARRCGKRYYEQLLVIADCVYNPSLLPALLATIDHFAVPGRTSVLVAVELRAADVVREFLQLWLGLGSWEIWRVGSRCRDVDVERGCDDDGWLGVDFAVWIGWKCT